MTQALRNREDLDRALTDVVQLISPDLHWALAELQRLAFPDGSADTHTVADLLEAYASEYLPHQAWNTQRRKRYEFAILSRVFGAERLTDLTPGRLRLWRDTLSARLAPGSVVTAMQTLSAALTVAVEDYEWLATNPMDKVHKPALPAERVRFLDRAEQRRLLDACQRSRYAVLYPLVLLALTTGARKMECLMLRWSDVDLTGGAIRLERTKTRLKRGVPMPQMTVDVLRPWQAQASNPYVFPGVRSQPPDIDRRWRAAVEHAQVKDFRFHDLRHTAASYLALSGVRIEDIADILGHRNLQTTRRYIHLTMSHTKAMIEQMAEKFISP